MYYYIIFINIIYFELYYLYNCAYLYITHTYIYFIYCILHILH